MKYIVYLTENLKCQIEGHNCIYIGVHETDNPDIFDGYIGCGVKIQQPSTYKYPKSAFQYAVKKYGTSAFKRTVLYIYDTKEEAYSKEHDLVDEKFIKCNYTYNQVIGGQYEERYKPLYQFDLKGNLVKEWTRSLDAYEFYGYPPERWDSPKKNKCQFLDSFWSTSKDINLEEYSIQPLKQHTYLYSKEGKLLKEFESQADCARYLNYNTGSLSVAIKVQSLIKKEYYVTNKLTDYFKPSARKLWMTYTYYVYKDDKFIKECIGKELMNVIGLHSWDKVNGLFAQNNGWYKDFYVSLKKIDKVPAKKVGNGISVDIYDKYGNFIERLSSCKLVREKYKIPSSTLKNIKLGDKYYGNYIFKYSNK